MPKYEIRDIRRGKKEQGRDCYIYASVYDVSTDPPVLCVSATLGYCHDWIVEKLDMEQV